LPGIGASSGQSAQWVVCIMAVMGAAITRYGIATVSTRAMTDSHDMNQPMQPEAIGMSIGGVGGGLKV
jgi:hypothetical protein